MCLYRHCMDVVASGLEAARWGFNGVWFRSIPRLSPDNLVRALTSYWVDKVMHQLQFERAHPEQCLRIFYETLAAWPERTMGTVFNFLKLPWNNDLIKFGSIGLGELGPGDHKAPYTDEIVSDSIGSGCIIPVKLIPHNLLTTVNGCLRELGYPLIDDRWDQLPSPFVLPGRLHKSHSEDASEVLALLRTAVIGSSPHDPWCDNTPRLEIILDDPPHGSQRVVVNFAQPDY